MNSLININKISITFQKGNIITGVSNLNFEIFPGEILSIVGPSGSGKTTVLKLLSSLLIPDQGEIKYHNEDIRLARNKGFIGLIPQQLTLLPNRNVFFNISLPLEIKKSVDNNKINEIIKLVGLEGFENFYPHQLSGGMKQRVSIARALVYQPSLLLMDEPFSSLDEIIRERLNLELLEIQKKINQTIVFVTHNIEEAVFMSDRIIVLTGQPGYIVDQHKVDLPKIRTKDLRYSDVFFEATKKVRQVLEKSYV